MDCDRHSGGDARVGTWRTVRILYEKEKKDNPTQIDEETTFPQKYIPL